MNENDLLVVGKVSDNEVRIILVDGNSSKKNAFLSRFIGKEPAHQTSVKTEEKRDMEPQVVEIEKIPTNDWIQIYFTPSLDCENNIIAQIEKAKKMDIAVYAITNDNIVDAILAAQKRGAKIRIITDRLQSKGKGSLVPELESAGLPVRRNTVHKIMHNKFAVFDGREIVTGSYNWTDAASNSNSENCVFFRQPNTKAFSNRFQYLWDFYGGDLPRRSEAKTGQ